MFTGCIGLALLCLHKKTALPRLVSISVCTHGYAWGVCVCVSLCRYLEETEWEGRRGNKEADAAWSLQLTDRLKRSSTHCMLSVLCNPWVCALASQAGCCAQEELKGMADRINSMRTLLFQELQRVGAPGKWSHIVEQIGMFSYTGLTRVR